MPSSTQYDPAWDTLRFDILAVMSLIGLETRGCDACRHTLLGTAQRAFNTILVMANSISSTTGSTILSAWVEPADTTGPIYFTTTANPTPVRVLDALLVRNTINPERTREMIDRVVFDALLVTGEDDTLFGNLRHAQLWLVLDGRYTVADAVRTGDHTQKSLGEFARAHMALLNALARAQGGNVDPLPVTTNVCTACLGFQDDDTLDCNMTGYPWGGDITLQTQALCAWWIPHHMDKSVANIVRDGLFSRSRAEWPKQLVPKGTELVPDWVAVLDGLERLPAFQARLRGLARSDEQYQKLQEKVEDILEEWREGADARAAAVASMMQTNTELARRVRGEVGPYEEAAHARSMLQDLVNELMHISEW
jgi:hypothetical protein